MDQDGESEVTRRLRSAIKKKLSEISDFVDDELPEYIMILVANQRSKTQIEKDLSLFLRNDTVSFTSWLFSLLNNINIGSTNDNCDPKSDSGVSKQKETDIDQDTVVLNCEPDEQDNELLSNEDTNESMPTQPSANSSLTGVKTKAVKEKTEPQEATIKSIPDKVKKEQHPEKRAIPKNVVSEVKLVKSQPKRDSKDQLSSKVVSVKKRPYDSDDEYDPSKPEFAKSATPRNYGGTAAFQANKLLLKAVDDATKSVLVGQNVEDFYKPTPIKVLHSKRFRSSLETAKENYCTVQPISFQDKIKAEIDINTEFNSDLSQNSLSNEQQYSNIFGDELSNNSQNLSNKGRTICLRNIPLEPESPELENLEHMPQNPSIYSFPVVEEVEPKSPHFIVTMEGVSLNSFKKRFDENSHDSMEEDMEVDEINEDVSSKSKVQNKISERCKFWPACKNSDDCLYHHPTTPCKCFPDCKFGDKCLYIHPNCKFDALCSRKDCPYTHASKRKLPLTTLPVRMIPIPVKPPRAKVVCKYYPKCTVKNCAYIHPKLCRYGTECRLPSCLFSHFSLPSRSQLKWQARDS